MRMPGCYRYWMARRRFRRSWKARSLSNRFDALMTDRDSLLRAELQAYRLAKLHPKYKRRQRRLRDA